MRVSKKHFLFLLFFYIATILFLAITTPITPHEAKYFYLSSPSITTQLIHGGYAIIPHVFGVRLFFILFALLSVWLFYTLSQRSFRHREDVYLSTALFMFLPGILTASAMANIAIIVLFLVLLFLLCYERGQWYCLLFILFALFMIHEASLLFFIALLFYAIAHKEKPLAIIASAFIIGFFYLEKGIEIGGRPSGHFVEIFGLYATVFSPLLFFYFFYAMYRILLHGKKSLMWYISFTALITSLLLSIRQKVYITDFAPYVMISTIAMVDIFNHSVKVRLPQFRRYYYYGFYSVVFVELLSTLMLLGTHRLYQMTRHHHYPIASSIYGRYELAQKLHQKGVNCYHMKGRGKYQLRYYGINACKE